MWYTIKENRGRCMKKIISFLFFLAIIIIPGKVFAISGNINLSCSPATAFPGDTITCELAAEVTDGSVNEFTATTTLSDNLEFVSSSVSGDWTGTSNGGIFNLKATESKSDSFAIATFYVKLKSDATSNGTITVSPTKLGDISQVGSVTKTITLSTSTNTVDTSDPNASDEDVADTNTDIKNPTTGSSIPFMIIGIGTIGAIVVYELASKNKRLHKI